MNRFYVAKNGCDSNSGTAEAPFLTIKRAQKAVRELTAAGLSEPVTVTVGAGEYREGGIVFDGADSGTADCPITWRAEGQVVLNGGIRLRAGDFLPLDAEEKIRLHGAAKDMVVKADLKKYGLTRADWGELCAIGNSNSAAKYDNAVVKPMACELFVNDVRMTIARYPDEGFLHSVGYVRMGRDMNADRAEWEKARNVPGDILKIDAQTGARAVAWKTLEGVWVFGYPCYGWADASSPLAGLDAEKCEMETVYASGYGLCEASPYYFYNVFEELDTPGEWYLDREAGILYLYPSCDLREADINLSIMTETLWKIDGATDITLQGFNFTATRGDAVTIRGDRNTIDGCEIKNVAECAVRAEGSHCTVKNCNIHHTGRGGITMKGGDRNTLTSSGNLVTNNHIHHIAEIFRTYQAGVQILGVNCVVSHNCIHDSAHMAIGFSGNEHVIEYNEIYNVCQIADDSSAIYAGRNYTVCGNVIRYNYFHDMSSEAAQHIGIFAVYCDDNLGGTQIYGNVMHRCQSALLLHGGHDMVFKNNLIIDACKKSRFCLRFHRYGYWETLKEPDGTHIRNLAEVPWQSELWKERYPHIGEYLTWDPEKEQAEPHYCDISNNMIINHAPIDVQNFNCFDLKLHNHFENNVQIRDRAFAGIPEGDTLDLSHNRFAEIIPGFAEIPFEKMGLLKD